MSETVVRNTMLNLKTALAKSEQELKVDTPIVIQRSKYKWYRLLCHAIDGFHRGEFTEGGREASRTILEDFIVTIFRNNNGCRHVLLLFLYQDPELKAQPKETT